MTVAAIGSAVLYTVFLWWFSTGAILWLDRLPRATHRWSLAAATAVAAAAASAWSPASAIPRLPAPCWRSPAPSDFGVGTR